METSKNSLCKKIGKKYEHTFLYENHYDNFLTR